MNIFGKTFSANGANSGVELLTTLRETIDAGTVSKDNVTGLVFGNESISERDRVVVGQRVDALAASITSARQRLNLNSEVSSRSLVLAAESASTAGALAAIAGTSFASRDLSLANFRGSEGQVFAITAEGAPSYSGKRDPRIVAACEAFDQREGRNAAIYSAAFNYTVAMSDEFTDTVWPLITLPVDQVGFGIVVNRLTVHRGVTYDISGRAKEIQKIDLCRAGVDYTVLSRKKNAAVPIHRAAAADKFVATTDITPWDYTVEGANFKTSALATGVQVNLLGLSQTDAQLASGAANQTDTMDPALSLDNLYVKAGDDVFSIAAYGRQGANFVFNPQGRPEDRILAFKSKYIVLSKDTTRLDGSALTTLGVMKTKSISVVLEVAASGDYNYEFGNVSVYGNSIKLVRAYVTAANGTQSLLDEASSDFQDLLAAFQASKIIGYTVRAYKTNVNLRETGDFVDRNQFTQLYEVPLLSPITYQRPISSNGENDSADFETLVTTCRFRIAGDAVTAIFETLDRIRAFTEVPFNNEDAPSGLGAARFHVKPYLAESIGAQAVNVASVISTLDSVQAAENVQAVIMNKMRDMIFSAFINSEFPSALRALGVPQESVEVIIITDPYIRRYLTIAGDTRLLSEKFKYRIVETIDKRFAGQVVMVFGVFDANRNQGVNIVNFGNLVWGSEVVVSSNLPRGDVITRETIVQPRYLFVNHCPVACRMEVKGIDEVFVENFIRAKQV